MLSNRHGAFTEESLCRGDVHAQRDHAHNDRLLCFWHCSPGVDDAKLKQYLAWANRQEDSQHKTADALQPQQMTATAMDAAMASTGSRKRRTVSPTDSAAQSCGTAVPNNKRITRRQAAAAAAALTKAKAAGYSTAAPGNGSAVHSNRLARKCKLNGQSTHSNVAVDSC